MFRTMKELLKIFRDMFGEQFLDNTLFEVTNWHFDRSSIRIRKNQNGVNICNLLTYSVK